MVKQPALRFGQGPRLRLLVDPQYGDMSTIFRLLVVGLRPTEELQLTLSHPDGSRLIRRIGATGDGAIGPLFWRPSEGDVGQHRLDAMTVESRERAHALFYVREHI